jgi:hypothetical protein
VRAAPEHRLRRRRYPPNTARWPIISQLIRVICGLSLTAAMSNSDTVQRLKSLVEAATANADHWLGYRDLVMRALPEGLPQHKQMMLRWAFDKMHESSDLAGFHRGIAWAEQVYGITKRPPQPKTPDSDTVRDLKFSATAAAVNDRHWRDYLALVMRALPEGLNKKQREMLRCDFDTAWQAFSETGFKSNAVQLSADTTRYR